MSCELVRCFPDQEVLEWVKWVVVVGCELSRCFPDQEVLEWVK